jgi:hypothetical protein
LKVLPCETVVVLGVDVMAAHILSIVLTILV